MNPSGGGRFARIWREAQRAWQPVWPPGRPVWRRVAVAAALTGVVSVVACSALPARDPHIKPLPPKQTAAAVTVRGHDGALPAAAEAQALARVRDEGNGALLQRHLGVLAAAGSTQLWRGNTARLLVDGPATFAAMKAAIASARHRLMVEFYIVEDEGVAAEVGDLLRKKAAEGVQVALMYDSIGSLGTDKAYFDKLREGGVAVCEFNPVNPLARPGHWGVTERNHRKMLAADSDVAFTGGINLSNVYAKGSGGSGLRRKARDKAADDRDDANRQGWRDTQVELRGPVVGALAQAFRANWQAQGCPGQLAPDPAPQVKEPGQRIVQLITGDPEHGANPTYTALLRAIDASQRSVQLTMAYFAPGPELIQALCDAARRGVAVSLVLPGRSDVKMVLYAARSHYAELLAAGVQIHELSQTVMHAKTAVIDGVLSSVGSSNLDWRSIVGNQEVDVIVLGDDFGQQMQALFARDVAVSQPIDAARWSQRGLGERFLETLGRAMKPLL